jgi:hypothetical protein
VLVLVHELCDGLLVPAVRRACLLKRLFSLHVHSSTAMCSLHGLLLLHVFGMGSWNDLLVWQALFSMSYLHNVM